MITVIVCSLYTLSKPSYHGLMKRFFLSGGIGAFAAILLAASKAPEPNPALLRVKTVYVLPMSHGLDQHLANQLTSLGVLQVVTDPKQADSILTDRLGEPFERKMTELYPPPKPPAPAVEAAAKPDDDKTKPHAATASEKAEAARISSENEVPMVASFGRNNGMVFLVDRASRNVLWSLYNKPKDSQAATLDHAANKIVRSLRAAMYPSPKSNGASGQ